MKILSKAEIGLWCSENSVYLNERGLPERPGNSEKFVIPKDAQKRVALALDKMQIFAGEPSLVWFDDWDVWPSGQRMHIFDRLRRSYGDDRALSEAPGHVFETREFEDAISFVTVGVLFLWDCYVVSPSGKFLFFSHDEWGVSNETESSVRQPTQH